MSMCSAIIPRVATCPSSLPRAQVKSRSDDLTGCRIEGCERPIDRRRFLHNALGSMEDAWGYRYFQVLKFS